MVRFRYTQRRRQTPFRFREDILSAAVRRDDEELLRCLVQANRRAFSYVVEVALWAVTRVHRGIDTVSFP